MTVLWIVLGVVLVGLLVALLPDLVRYIKLRSM
jgi:hypothetical protein